MIEPVLSNISGIVLEDYWESRIWGGLHGNGAKGATDFTDPRGQTNSLTTAQQIRCGDCCADSIAAKGFGNIGLRRGWFFARGRVKSF